MSSPSFYNGFIRQRLAALGHVGVDPVFCEAVMRLAHPTLDHLTPQQFDDEVAVGAMAYGMLPEEKRTALIRSMGLEVQR